MLPRMLGEMFSGQSHDAYLEAQKGKRRINGP